MKAVPPPGGVPPSSSGRRPLLPFLLAALPLAALLAAGACAAEDDLTTLDPPPPQPGALRIEPGDLPLSSISVPVDVSTAVLHEAVEEGLPSSIGSLDRRMQIPGNDRLSLAWEISRGPIETRFDDGRAHVAATLSYGVRAWYDPPVLPEVSASCGTDDGPPPRLRVRLASPITLDRDWTLRTDVAAMTIRPATDTERDRCEVTVFDIDATGQVIEGARSAFSALSHEINELVSEIDVRSDFEGWWETIAEPVELTERVWLVLAPDSVDRTGIVGQSGEVLTTLTLHARPRIVIGERPDVDVSPLPPVDSADVPGEGVRIVAEAVAGYAEITRRLNDAVAGRSFEARGRTLTVERLQVSGVGDGRVSVRADLDGDVRGTVFLVATPTYDRKADEIHVDDLDFDVRTRDRLVASAAWVARTGLISEIRSAAHFPATDARAWALEKVHQGFNARISPEVRLEGIATAVEIESVTAGSDALRIRTVVTGEARLLVEPS